MFGGRKFTHLGSTFLKILTGKTVPGLRYVCISASPLSPSITSSLDSGIALIPVVSESELSTPLTTSDSIPTLSTYVVATVGCSLPTD